MGKYRAEKSKYKSQSVATLIWTRKLKFQIIIIEMQNLQKVSQKQIHQFVKMNLITKSLKPTATMKK